MKISEGRTDWTENAMKVVAYELSLFSRTIDEHWRDQFFHPMNRDEWVRGFCEWFADKQAKSAAIRASND